MLFAPGENKEDTEGRHGSEAHVGPGLGQGRRPVGQKAVQEIAVKTLRPEKGHSLGPGRPGILQKAQHDRQKDHRRQHRPDQPVKEEGDPVQDHPAQLTDPPQAERAPDRVQDRHDDQHIEKIKIAHGRDKDHEDEEPRLFFAEISLAAQQEQREKHKGIEEIMMAHARHGKAVENVDQGPRQHARTGPPAHVEGIGAEGDAGHPEPGHQHQVMEMQQISLRHKDRRQAEGIADHIIGQGRKEILPVADPQAEGGHPQRMRLLKIPQDLLPPPGKIQQAVIVLVDPVRLPDKTLSLQPEPHKDRCRHKSEQQGIRGIVDNIILYAQTRLLSPSAFVSSLHSFHLFYIFKRTARGHFQIRGHLPASISTICSSACPRRHIVMISLPQIRPEVVIYS